MVGEGEPGSPGRLGESIAEGEWAYSSQRLLPVGRRFNPFLVVI